MSTTIENRKLIKHYTAAIVPLIVAEFGIEKVNAQGQLLYWDVQRILRAATCSQDHPHYLAFARFIPKEVNAITLQAALRQLSEASLFTGIKQGAKAAGILLK